jgi:hypothetical protein
MSVVVRNIVSGYEDRFFRKIISLMKIMVRRG